MFRWTIEIEIDKYYVKSFAIKNENKIYSLSNLGLNDRPKKQISIAPFF